MESLATRIRLNITCLHIAEIELSNRFLAYSGQIILSFSELFSITEHFFFFSTVKINLQFITLWNISLHNHMMMTHNK